MYEYMQWFLTCKPKGQKNLFLQKQVMVFLSIHENCLRYKK
jgi:hypothetical protein